MAYKGVGGAWRPYIVPKVQSCSKQLNLIFFPLFWKQEVKWKRKTCLSRLLSVRLVVPLSFPPLPFPRYICYIPSSCLT